MNREKLIYMASIFALVTAGMLAWAVSRPCDCHSSDTEVTEVVTEVGE